MNICFTGTVRCPGETSDTLGRHQLSGTRNSDAGDDSVSERHGPGNFPRVGSSRPASLARQGHPTSIRETGGVPAGE